MTNEYPSMNDFDYPMELERLERNKKIKEKEEQLQKVKEKVKEINLRYLTLCKNRDDYTPAMVEAELTDQILSIPEICIKDEDQSLSSNNPRYPVDNFHAQLSYLEGQEDAKKANFVKVLPRE